MDILSNFQNKKWFETSIKQTPLQGEILWYETMIKIKSQNNEKKFFGIATVKIDSKRMAANEFVNFLKNLNSISTTNKSTNSILQQQPPNKSQKISKKITIIIQLLNDFNSKGLLFNSMNYKSFVFFNNDL